MSSGGATNSRDWLLAIDNGTQSVRALVFDLQGNVLFKSKVELEPYFSEHPGWAEQHPDYYWESLCKACHGLWEQVGDQRGRIIGLAVTTQRGTVINVDASGKVLRPAITWLDQRLTEPEGSLGMHWDLAFKVLGAEGAIRYFRERAQANWIAKNQPDVWAATHKFLLLSGYLNYRFTGRFADSVGCQVGYIPFDYKKLQWAPDWDWKWKAVCIPQRMLPELVSPCDEIGRVTGAAAADTGIPEGLPVIAAGSDKSCEVIGAGATDPGVACMSYGTTATINTNNARYVEVVPLIPPYPSAIPDTYCTEVMIYRGFWMVSWFKQQFGLREQHIAEQRGVPPEALFDELVHEVPPGSMGLTLQPYWTPGVKEPGPEAKGAIIGFGDVHTRAHMYRAILEGICYGLREGKERTEKRNGQRIRTLRVSGGGSQSNAAMQITADVFGMAAERPHTFETSGLGAAINCAVGVGRYADVRAAMAAMTRVGEKFVPDPATHRTYDRLYNEVYRRMYKRLQPLYKSIREITGYPS